MSRWDTTERPVLEAVYAVENEQIERGTLDKARIAEVSDVNLGELIRSLGYLAADGLIRVIDAGTSEGPDYLVEGVTPDGLRALGEWPTDERLAALIPTVLHELAEQADDEDMARIYRNAGHLLNGVATTTLATLIKSLDGLDS